MKNKTELLNYIALGALILGQVVIGFNFIIGQALFVIADIFLVVRAFMLKGANSEKIKNGIMTLFAVGSLVINII